MRSSKIEKSPSILYENNFKNESDQNSKSRSIFIWEIPLNWSRLQFYKRNTCEIYKRITFKIYRDFFCKYTTFSPISKKTYQEGFFDFFLSGPPTCPNF